MPALRPAPHPRPLRDRLRHARPRHPDLPTLWHQDVGYMGWLTCNKTYREELAFLKELWFNLPEANRRRPFDPPDWGWLWRGKWRSTTAAACHGNEKPTARSSG